MYMHAPEFQFRFSWAGIAKSVKCGLMTALFDFVVVVVVLFVCFLFLAANVEDDCEILQEETGSWASWENWLPTDAHIYGKTLDEVFRCLHAARISFR